MTKALPSSAVQLARAPSEVLDVTDRLPVVARLVVEVRSDGSRTVARGVIEDLTSGERTTIEGGAQNEHALLAMVARAALSLTRLAAARTSRQLAFSAAAAQLLSMASWTKRVLSRASAGGSKG